MFGFFLNGLPLVGRFLKTYLLPFLIVLLSGLLWFHSDRADKLAVELSSMEAQKAELAHHNQQLVLQIQAEQQAVKFQQQIANRLQKQVEQSNERIKTILQQDKCGRQPVPRSVGDELKRLHQQGNHKDKSGIS